MFLGLCSKSEFDVQYSWAVKWKNGRHYFRGYTSSEIFWDGEKGRWTLQMYGKRNVTAYTNGTRYPFGTRPWAVEGDASGNQPGAVNHTLLSLTSCAGSEFNCGNGWCVDMAKRCDGRLDCPDKSGSVIKSKVEGLRHKLAVTRFHFL